MLFSRIFSVICFFVGLALRCQAVTRYVTVNGGTGGQGTALAQPWSLAKACSSAGAGDVVLIQPGIYAGKFEIAVSGTALAPITFRADGAAGTVVIDGTGQTGAHDGLIFIRANNTKLVAQDLVIEGLELRNFLNVDDASGIRILCQGNGVVSRITLRRCNIHEIRGLNAMGITVYGQSSLNAITGITLEGCEVSHCDPSPSEAVVFNGNVDGFMVKDCLIRDCNNIGLDMIGGEPGFPVAPAEGKVARNGLVQGCRVSNIINAVGISAAGIYVDGGRLITIEHCRVETSDFGMEIGSENFGIVTDNVTVRNNVLINNRFNGLAVGGAEPSNGRVNNCFFRHNLLYGNGSADPDATEILIQYGSGNVFENNIIQPRPDDFPSFIYQSGGNAGNVLRNNLWYTPGGDRNTDADYGWVPGVCCGSYAEFQTIVGQDGGGLYADPQFFNAPGGDFHLNPGSPARNAGAAAVAADAALLTDMDGLPRLQGSAPDIGPDEVWPVDAWWRAAFPAVTLTAAQLMVDPDGDGASNLLEYAGGSLPANAGSRPVFGPLAGAGVRGFQFQKATAATDTELRLFRSGDLAAWLLSPVVPVAGPVTSGRQTLTWTLPAPPAARIFLRMEARLKP